MFWSIMKLQNFNLKIKKIFTTLQIYKMIWHLKAVKAGIPREADIDIEHLCSVRKCSIGVNL